MRVDGSCAHPDPAVESPPKASTPSKPCRKPAWRYREVAAAPHPGYDRANAPFKSSIGRRLTAMGIIDCDTHPALPEGLSSLVPFMPKVLAERFGQPGIGGRERESVARPGFRYKHPSKTFVIPDATPPSGARAGSDKSYFS